MPAVLRTPVPSVPSSPEQTFDTVGELVKSSESIRDLLFALIETLDNYPPTLITDVHGVTGNALMEQLGFAEVPATGVAGSFPWNLKNTTTGSTGQVQLNGGDGQVAQLNAKVSQISGNPTDTTIGSPAHYPQLAISGNGYVYAKATPTTAGTASPLTSLDITFQTSVQAQSTANPATYYWMLVATISNYAVDGSGNVSFTVNNAYGSGYGPSTLIYCATTGVISVY